MNTCDNCVYRFYDSVGDIIEPDVLSKILIFEAFMRQFVPSSMLQKNSIIFIGIFIIEMVQGRLNIGIGDD